MLLTVVLLLLCAIIAIAAIPLMLRLVPPNPVYGVPTEKTLSRKDAWYEVSAFGGVAVLVAVALAGMLLMFYNGTWLRSGWAQLATLIVPLAIAVGATIAFERRFVPKGRADEVE